MTMFGSFGRLFGIGANPNGFGYDAPSPTTNSGFSPPIAADPSQPQSAPQLPTPSQPSGSMGGFQPHALSFGDKLGLAGDIWSGNPVTQRRLDGDYQSDLQAYQLNHPTPSYVPGVGLVRIDPMTGRSTVVTPEPPKTAAPHYWQTNDGSLASVDATGPHVVYQDPTPKTTWLTADNGDGTKQLIPMTANGPIGSGVSPPSGGAALPPGYTVRPKGGAASGPRTFPAEAAYNAIVQHESNGRVGVTGPQTRYGRAQGLSQMLPATAQAMAGKLGLPWRPELMTATSDVAAQYQRALGRAYFEEGLDRTGNVHDAAQYYHAGPDRRLWGPKTRAYADGVVASLET